jgi:hypothetical protein
MNITLLQTLPRKDSSIAKYATISKLDGTSAWRFLLMPRELNFKRNINYQSTSTSTNIPILQFASLEGWNLTATIPLYSREYDITEHALSISKLMEPDPITPPILTWRWGNRLLSPCIMTQCDRTEFDWFPDGRLRGCNLAIGLAEVNEKMLVI